MPGLQPVISAGSPELGSGTPRDEPERLLRRFLAEVERVIDGHEEAEQAERQRDTDDRQNAAAAIP